MFNRINLNLNAMKRIFFILSIVTMFCMSSYAQDDMEENLPNVIKINPISLAFGNFNLSYQRAIGSSSAIQIGANYLYKLFGSEVSGFGLRGSYQFFLTGRAKEAPEGFYIGPQIAYNSFKEKLTDVSVSTFGFGLMVGYQWIWKSGMALDLGIGPMYVIESDSETEESFEGFLPNVIIALGYNF